MEILVTAVTGVPINVFLEGNLEIARIFLVTRPAMFISSWMVFHRFIVNWKESVTDECSLRILINRLKQF